MASSVEKSKTSSEDAHSLVKQQFLDSENSTLTERTEAETHRAYFDGKQWTDEEVAEIEARGQPVITDNKIKDKVEYLLGMERKTRTDPKAYPRNARDEASADAATDALRYVADDNMFNYVRSDASENMFIEGRGAIEIIVDKKYGGKIPKICLRHIRWDRLYVDPRSMKADYSDKSYVGTITWMDFDVAVEKWKDKRDVLDLSFADVVPSETYDDTPQFVILTTTRKRIQIFQHYYLKGGKWWYCEFVSGGFLKDPAESAYLDENGEPSCPIEVQAMYREGKTGRAYGVIRRYKDLQDDWNKRRSKSLHYLNTNQVLMEDGAAGSEPDAVDRVRAEAARPDGVIRRIPGMELELVKNLDLSQGHISLMMLTGQSLDATGPNAALSGQTGSISGRAKQIDQQGGLVQIDKPFDAIKYLTLRVYRQVWNRVKQFWTAETWIRVRDDEQLKFVALNRKVTRAEVIADELKSADMADEEKAAILQQIASDPQYKEPVVLNNVAEIDVDITIDDSPDVLTLQQEQFGTLAELAKAGLPIPPKALIEASSLRNKRKILDAMSGANDPMQQQMAQMQQQLAQLELSNKQMQGMLLEAQVRKTVTEAEKNAAATVESQVDAAVKVAQFISPETPAAPKTQVSVN